jgi:pyruvate dehydrogenase E1 component beta subunit
VLDLRSLVPLDLHTLAESVRRTGRVVVVHEAPRTLGMGAEIAARIMEEGFDYLEAPVLRVTGYDVPYPPAALEQRYLPSIERITAAVRMVVNH